MNGASRGKAMDQQAQVMELATGIADTTKLAPALDRLKQIGVAIGIPLVMFLDNLAAQTRTVQIAGRPSRAMSPRSTEFYRVWHERQYHLNSPVYLACRTEFLPFIWQADGRGPPTMD